MPTRDVSFSTTAWKQYQEWQKLDKKILKKINSLINETQRNPFTGTGKPEALKGDLSGYWSRRITQEHRLVYLVSKDRITIIQCKRHY